MSESSGTTDCRVLTQETNQTEPEDPGPRRRVSAAFEVNNRRSATR